MAKREEEYYGCALFINLVGDVHVTPEVLVAAPEQHCGVRRSSATKALTASCQSSLRQGAELAGVVSPLSGMDDEVAMAEGVAGPSPDSSEHRCPLLTPFACEQSSGRAVLQMDLVKFRKGFFLQINNLTRSACWFKQKPGSKPICDL
jgi:hypothetical protein